MKAHAYHSLVLLLLCIITFDVTTSSEEDDRFHEYLTSGNDSYNKRYEKRSNHEYLLSWEYNTNITEYNQQRMVENGVFMAEAAKNDSKYVKATFNRADMTNSSLMRQYDKLVDIGTADYEDLDVLKRISNLEAAMKGIYSSATWCQNPKDNSSCKALEPGLTDIFTTSRDYDELSNAWKGWRDVSGAKMRNQYEEFVALMNKAIKAGGLYEDMGAYYRSWYEQPTFETDARDLFTNLSPLYDQLHAYVRNKLKAHYGQDKFPVDGHIPAHIFGNMWAQSWGNTYSLLEPFPGKGLPSLTTIMKDKNYNITYMYRVAEDFFKSLGMAEMPPTFWTHSMLEKPADRDVVCHASAWDFYNGTDFRIKQCTEVTEEQMITVHHEMGHVQYFLEYINQPVLFRGGANPGFHEGVADIVSLSFQTPEHLREIGLIQELPNGTEGDINFLFQMALDKVAFLPFGYLIDQWRWGVYRGETTPENYNRHWWDLRYITAFPGCKFQGISPPVPRSENDFDPGAKYHIAGNTPYIRYFVSFVAQFQWHKALCELIGQAEPLHRCDIYRNKTAGARLREMLQMGSSRPWGEAMQAITRNTSGYTDKLDAQALLDYFKPLQDWLTTENAKTGETIGWDRSKCPEGSFLPPTVINGASHHAGGAIFNVNLFVYLLMTVLLF